MSEPAYRTLMTTRAARIAKTLAIGGALVLVSTLPAFAQSGEVFSGGGEVGKSDGYTTYTYGDAPYAVTYNDALYLYGTAEDGKGYYTTYQDAEWSAYAGWDTQTVNFKWQPTSVEYGGSQYVYYAGEDNKLYQTTYDGSAWSDWQDTSGPYTYTQAPYANTYGDSLYLYGAADDGNLYYKSSDGTAWTDWAAVNDDYAAKACQPYAVDWGDYENVFWTGEDGKVYWNRYDGTAWSGAKALPGEYSFDYSSYAVGYDGKLYAHAVAADGLPYYNAFTEGEGWTGWQAYASAPAAEVTWQPSAYTYDGKQHVVYTGANGHAYYTSYDGSWSDWADLGANYAYEPIQYEYADAYYLAYTGEDGSIYYKTYADGAADTEDEPTPEY